MLIPFDALSDLNLPVNSFRLNFVLTGAGGSGKSSICNRIPGAIDLEQYPKSMRTTILSMTTNAIFGAADVNPKIYDTNVFWIVLKGNLETLFHRNLLRASEQVEKWSQPSLLNFKSYDFFKAKLYTVINIENWADVDKLADAIMQFIAKIRFIERENLKTHFTNNFPIEEIKKVLQRTDLPRKIVYDEKGRSFDDYTPYCVYPNWVLNDRYKLYQPADVLSGFVQKEGIYVPYREFEIQVNKLMEEKEREVRSLLISRFFKSRARPLDMVRPIFMLPLKGLEVNGKRNLTNQDFLIWGDKLTDIFIRSVLLFISEHCIDDVEFGQYVQLLSDYSCTLDTTLEVCANEQFHTELNDEEKKMLFFAQQCNDKVFNLIEDNLTSMFQLEPELPSMNLTKSPGLYLTMASGVLFKTKDFYEYPNDLFNSLKPEYNAWVKKNYYPIKFQGLQDSIIFKRKRYNGLIQGKYYDPNWHIQMLLEGAAYINTVAFRINGNDDVKYVVGVDDSKLIWDVKLEPIVNDDRFRNFILNGDLSLVSGKPREYIFCDDLKGFAYAYLSPYQYCSLIKMLDKAIGVTRYYYCGNRLRGIYPGYFPLNLADGCVIRYFSRLFEKCDIGFPDVKPESDYVKNMLSDLAQYRNVLPIAMDTTHFETWFASNEWLMLLFGKKDSHRYIAMLDRSSGFITTRAGLKFHGQQTSSGISDTTFHNIIASFFSSTVSLAKLSVEPLLAFKQLYTNSLLHVLTYMKSKFRINVDNLIREFQTWASPDIITKKGKLHIRHYFGTDDQLKHLCSNEMTVEEIRTLFENKSMQDWRARCPINFDYGESAHFGIVITKDGFRLNKKGVAEKFFSLEKRNLGDLICVAYVTAFSEDKLLAQAIQAGLDAINGGSIEAYKLGADWATIVLRTFPDYTQDVMDSLHVEYSPTAKLIAKGLADAGYKPGASKKVPVEIVAQHITDYLTFKRNFYNGTPF